MNTLHIMTTVTGALLLASGPVGAEVVSKLKDRLGQFSADLAMPPAAAAVHVGLSADNVVQAKNRREFEGAVSGLLKDGGKPAGAFEFLPYYVAMGGKLPFGRYESHGGFRALTRVSLGAAAGTREIGDSKAKVSANGLSVSTVLVDLSDPIHSFRLQDCVNKVQAIALKEANASGTGDATPLPASRSTTVLGAGDAVVTPKADAAYGDCLKSFRSSAQLWNRSKVSLGIASGNGHEQAGEKRKVRYGTAAWLTVQYGFEGLDTLGRALLGKVYVDCSNVDATLDNPESCKTVAEDHWRDRSLLTLHARQVHKATVLDLSAKGPLAEVNSRLFGGRFTYGSEKRNFFLEFSRLADRHALNGKSTTSQRAFGASVKVMDNLWLNLVSGRRKDVAGNGTTNVVQVDLAYGLSQDPLVPSP